MIEDDNTVGRGFQRGYRLVKNYYDNDQLRDCIREASDLLDEPHLPRYFQIKTYILLGCCLEDYAEAERCLSYADRIYHIDRMLHRPGDDAGIDRALDDCLETITHFRDLLDEEFRTMFAESKPPIDEEGAEPFIVDARGWPTPAELDPDVEDLEFYGYQGDTDSEDLAEAEREVFAAGDLSIAEYRAMLMEFLPFASDESASQDENGSSDEEAEGAEHDMDTASAAQDLSTEHSVAVEVTEELAPASMAEQATDISRDTEMQAGPSHASVGRGGTLAIRNRLTGKQRMRRGQGKGEAPSSLRKLQQAFKGKDDEA